MKLLTFLILILVSCGQDTQDRRSKPDPELEKIKSTILELQGTINQINSFVASDFTTCSNNLPDFESKICQIAQTATAEQQVIFTGQLQQVVKIFQDQIYGDDCINNTDIGCPKAGSILDEVSQASSFASDISQLQSDVLQLQSDILSIQSRLDNFNGSGNSVELVISTLETNLADLTTRIDTIEQTINDGDIYKIYFVCEDIFDSGPVYEPVLMTGDSLFIYAYISSGSGNGMGVLAEAGVTGDVYSQTLANTKKCNFKIYDLTTELKLCWDNSSRNSSEIILDQECDSSNSFLNPTSNCTCRPL